MINKYVKYQNERRNRILNFFLSAIFGFLIPYVVINGMIYFLYTATPKINLIESDNQANNSPTSQTINFTIDCPIPLSGVVVSLLDPDDAQNRIPVPYTKLGDQYSVDITQNGSYEIVASALNKSLAIHTELVDTLDNTPPSINMESVILQANTITIEINDDQSGINYDNLYAINDSGKKENPQFLDESTGTVSFRFENTNSLTIHIEDISGNITEPVINKP